MTNPRWKRRPHGSTWGDFGPDDELGRLNLLTPEKVRQGVAEVREGLTFCLSLPLECPGGNVLNPRRHPPVIRPTLRGARPNFNFRPCEEIPDATDVICDDLVVLHLQYSTQWDSLAHVGQLFASTGTAGRRRSTTTAFAPTRTWSGRRKARTQACRTGLRARARKRSGSACTGWPSSACRAGG